MCGPWCCGWHARIRAGATGGSAVSWPDSASGYRPRRSVECSPAPDSTWPRGLRAGLARVPARAGREHRRVRLLVLRERAPAPVVRVVLHRACKPARLARRLHDPPMGRRVRARDRHGPAWCPRPPRQWSIRRRRSQPRHRARQRSRLSLGRATRVMGATSMRSSRAHAHARRVARRPPRARLRARVPASLTGSRIGRQRNARDKLAWGKRSADRSGRAPSLSSLEQRTLASARRSDGAARCVDIVRGDRGLRIARSLESHGAPTHRTLQRTRRGGDPGRILVAEQGDRRERLLRANSPRPDPSVVPVAGSRGHGSATALHGKHEPGPCATALLLPGGCESESSR
jgi:hypothetical protein